MLEKKYDLPAAMPGLGVNPAFSDKDIASIAKYLRDSFGNQKSSVKNEMVTKVRVETKIRSQPYSAKDFN